MTFPTRDGSQLLLLPEAPLTFDNLFQITKYFVIHLSPMRYPPLVWRGTIFTKNSDRFLAGVVYAK